MKLSKRKKPKKLLQRIQLTGAWRFPVKNRWSKRDKKAFLLGGLEEDLAQDFFKEYWSHTPHPSQ